MQNRLFRISLTTLGLVLCMNIVSCRAAGQELPQSEMQSTETTSVSAQIAATETTAVSETAAVPPETNSATEMTVSTAVPELATSTETTTAVTSAATQTTEKAPVIPEPLPNDGKRDALFAERTKTPVTIVRTSGTVKYTVTFDRAEYYVGDDLNLHITAENLGTEPILVANQANRDLGHLIRVMLCHGGVILNEIKMGYEGAIPATAYTIDHWEPGEIAEEWGRQPIGASMADFESSLLISVDGTHMVEVPLIIHQTTVTDCELKPYLDSGDITPALYDRVLVMNETETVPVVISKAWDRDKLLPDTYEQPTLYTFGFEERLLLEHDGAVAYLTRAQLIELLRHQSSLKTPSRPPLKDIYDNFILGFWASAYPLEELPHETTAPTGNPDPLPDCVVFDHQTDIQLRPFQSVYSMPNERSVWACRIEIPETLSVVAYSRYLNLEQQIGENWVRLSVHDENRVYHEENHADLAGRSLILEFHPNKVEPAITPGKYRFIFYATVEQDGKTENRMYYVPFEVVR